MELEQKDSELQFTRRELGEACQLVKDARDEHDRQGMTFQFEKEDLLRDLNQTQANAIEDRKKVANIKAKM